MAGMIRGLGMERGVGFHYILLALPVLETVIFLGKRFQYHSREQKRFPYHLKIPIPLTPHLIIAIKR